MNGVWVSGVDIDGDYTQAVVGNVVNGDILQKQLTLVRGRPATYLGPDEVERRLTCYVPAGNHDEIVRLLGGEHVIVLTGSSGIGRSTTAIAAMQQISPGIPIRRFLLDEEDVEGIGYGNPHGYLVYADDGGLDRLGSCVEAVRRSGDYLAVIADRKLAVLGAASLPSVPVEPPPPLPVYRHWVVRHHRLPEWALWEQAGVLLRDASPADARRLADLAADADERGGPLEERRAQAAQSYLEWNEHLREWFGTHQQPHDRALLLAAATLSSGASEGYVYTAASLLAEALRMDANGGGLAWCPVTGLRELLAAGLDDREINFPRANFPRAVLRHALTDYPLARAEVLTWLSQLPTGVASDGNKANEIAETFAELASEQGAAGHITKAARRWGGDGLADLAFIALSGPSLHTRTGGHVRQALREWSRTTNTPQTLKLVIVRVCQLVGQEYPSVALTRLKHLATRGNDQVMREVIATSMALADAGHRRIVTDAALQWCDADASMERLSLRERRNRRRAGARLFLKLAGAAEPSGIPTMAIGRPEVPTILAEAPEDGLRQAWRSVFAFLDGSTADYHDEVETTVYQWLDIALCEEAIRGRVCELFIAAATPVPFAESVYADNVAPAVIDIVLRWAALDRADTLRADIAAGIRIALTFSWWTRLLRILIWNLRILLRSLPQLEAK